MNQYRMFLVQTFTLTPRMHMESIVCKNYHLPTKSTVEAQDNSIDGSIMMNFNLKYKYSLHYYSWSTWQIYH